MEAVDQSVILNVDVNLPWDNNVANSMLFPANCVEI